MWNTCPERNIFPHAAIIDLDMLQVVDGDMVKVMSWYDNEWGYASQMVKESIS